jgi:hypothetical protein
MAGGVKVCKGCLTNWSVKDSLQASESESVAELLVWPEPDRASDKTNASAVERPLRPCERARPSPRVIASEDDREAVCALPRASETAMESEELRDCV